MGKLRKIGKKIGRGIKSVGKKFKKGLGKIAKAFGKLGPLGSIALSFMLPGIGSWISSVAQGSSFLAPIAQGLVKAGNFVKNGVGKVFNKVTDAIEYSMNKVSSLIPGGEGMAGSNFKNWVSETTGGFIEPSTEGIKDMSIPADSLKLPKPPKGMSKDAVFVDGFDTDLKAGFYEKTDLDKFYKGVDTPVDIDSTSFKSQFDVKAGDSSAITTQDGTVINPLDRKTIKTTEGVTPPKPGAKYFQRSKNAYKVVGPISTAGQSIQAGEDAEKFAKDMAQKQQAAYFADVAQTTLMKQPDPTTNLIDFNNPNPSTQDIYNLTNAYGGILGT
tara:strand:- start:2999 stop:3985 length:987 start_codon:yes stop_codon:yes gene_type:complete